MVPERIGTELRQRRVLVGKTQEDIARVLPDNEGGVGVTRAYVSAVERGVTWEPDADKLVAWAQALGWEPDYILRKLGRSSIPVPEGLSETLTEAIAQAVAKGVQKGVADALADIARQTGGGEPPPPPIG